MAAAGKEKVADVAYEDAAEPLQALRERMDAEAAAAIPEVWESAQQCVRNACQAIASGGSAQNGAATGGSGGAGAEGAGPSSAADEEDCSGSVLGGPQHSLCSMQDAQAQYSCQACRRGFGAWV